MKATLNDRTGSTSIIGDIYTGNIYKQHVQQNRLGSLHQLSYSLCTNGRYGSNNIVLMFSRKFKHSNQSLWPIWLVNNEIEPSIRFKKEYVKLFGIWFDQCEPYMNTFLAPSIQMFI